MNISKIPYKWLVAIAFVAGLFMDLMDTTIVNVALPKLATDFHTTDTTLEWVVNGYLLSLAIWIPASGWIGDKFGTKKVFLFALFMFTIGSALCGFAWNVESLIFFRVLQGIGGGMMTPIGTAMLFRAFPPDERASASSVTAVPIALAPAVGPVLGGWLVDYVSWHWIFWVNIPIGIAAFLFGLKFLKEHKEENAGKFDFAGFFLSGIGLVLLLFSLSTAPSHGWAAPEVLFSGIVGIVLLAILVFVEQKSKNPLLHFALFKDRLFRTTNIVMFFAFSVWLGFLFILPLFLQQLRGLSAFESGLTTFPQAIGWIVMSFFASRLYPKLGPKKMIVSGLVGVLITSLFFIFITTNTNLWIVRFVMFIRGMSMVFAMIPMQAAAFSNISSEETGRASSLFNTNRQVASSFGVALLGTILFQLIIVKPYELFDYHVTFITTTVLGLIAVLFALTIRDKDAAASLGKK
jgi:EmrB/QacA subfamily drug resistance transporter